MSGSTLLKVGKGEKDPNKANFGVRGKVTIVGYVPNPVSYTHLTLPTSDLV